MILTLDIKESALDKVLSLLNNLKSDVKIIENSLDIEVISPYDSDYKYIEDGKQERKSNPENYASMDSIDWN